MPQNPEKYFYLNRVGLVRGSWALRKFLEDAERHHMEDQPAKLAALRLTEYYELIERQAGGQAPPPGAVISSNGHAPAIETTPATAGKKGGRQRRILQDDDDDQQPGTTPQKDHLDPEAALDESADYWQL